MFTQKPRRVGMINQTDQAYFPKAS